jgi:hypothetical protein
MAMASPVRLQTGLVSQGTSQHPFNRKEVGQNSWSPQTSPLGAQE